ncbi:jg24970, partial [Pararge aegeria aegeria]
LLAFTLISRTRKSSNWSDKKNGTSSLVEEQKKKKDWGRESKNNTNLSERVKALNKTTKNKGYDNG